MRKLIVTALILCASVLLSCGLVSEEKSVEQTYAFEKNQYDKFDNKVEGLSESDLEKL